MSVLINLHCIISPQCTFVCFKWIKYWIIDIRNYELEVVKPRGNIDSVADEDLEKCCLKQEDI